MRLLFLNFAYGMGVDGSIASYILRIPLFFYAGRASCKKFAKLIAREKPDVVAIAEIDGGSMRAGFVPQWQELAHDNFYQMSAASKYRADAVWQRLPIIRKHMNCIATHKSLDVSICEKLYLSVGMKRLVLRQTISNQYELYMVHLALDFTTRQAQLVDLAHMIVQHKSNLPTILAGDFNVFRGRKEFDMLRQLTGLQFVSSQSAATFPAFAPTMELDFILVSPEVVVTHFEVLADIISDHRALLLEFDI